MFRCIFGEKAIYNQFIFSSMSKTMLKNISWILRGSQRREIIKVIEGLKVPAQIYQEAIKLNPKITRNSVSDVLRAFREKGLVECINPKEKKGRVYMLTERGKKVKKQIS